MSKDFKRFYWLSLVGLLAVSVYPLINGVRMAYFSITNGAIKPEQYAKYVIPYAAICTAIILFTVLQPLLYKLKRGSFLTGLIGASAIFVAVERFFERIQIQTTGMSLIDPASLSGGPVTIVPPTAVDAWQAALCVVSPLTQGQSLAYTSQDRIFYIMANDSYKIHFYLISFVLIAMVCGLIYSIGRMIRIENYSSKKAIFLQGMATAVLVSLCIFANTTAFFRQPEAIQTPVASILTCLFFIQLGVSVSVYAGSFLLKKGNPLGLGLPALLSIVSVVSMYVGEAVMMEGGLYRFGTGWFFDGLPGIALAPVDFLVILLSGIMTWLILLITRLYDNWPNKRTLVIVLLLCVLISAGGISYAVPLYGKAENNLFGCYEFDKSLYLSPLSSTYIPPEGGIPIVYGMDKDTFIIANTETGDIQQFSVKYENTPIAVEELSSGSDSVFHLPDVSHFQERTLRAVFSADGQHYYLYQMDGEIWLTAQSGKDKSDVWSIYRLKPTDKYTLSDLEYALNIQNNKSDDKTQMSLHDVYNLARKEKVLTPRDFYPFSAKAVGPEFSIMRYDIDGGCVLLVHTDTSGSFVNHAYLSKRGYDPFDEAITVDIRDGIQAAAAYLDPLHSLDNLQIEDPYNGTEKRELIYELGEYRFFLTRTRVDRIFITFSNGERLPLKQALEESRTTIEDLVANGLNGIVMEPINNPMNGHFLILHHLHKFYFEGEAFYPSKSFLFTAPGAPDNRTQHFDVSELIDVLTFQGRDELAEKLRSLMSTRDLTLIAGKTYLKSDELAEIGISVKIGSHVSSHTPVSFELVE